MFTLTASDTLENLTYLVENLPEVSFHIAAKTNVSDRLESFKKYDNVTLYTNVHHDDIIEDLLDQSEIYLDINHWDQVDSIVDRAFEKENRSSLLIMSFTEQSWVLVYFLIRTLK